MSDQKKLTPGSPMQILFDTMPQQGKVEWIGVRPLRSADVIELDKVEAIAGKGLEGDHYSSKGDGKRQVTLIQKEHMDTVSSIMKAEVPPGKLRRNIVVSGINLLALKGKRFTIRTVLLEYTGECHPCSRMEANLGPGGYNAMRGHGGITARIIEGGTIKTGDLVCL